MDTCLVWQPLRSEILVRLPAYGLPNGKNEPTGEHGLEVRIHLLQPLGKFDLDGFVVRWWDQIARDRSMVEKDARRQCTPHSALAQNFTKNTGCFAQQSRESRTIVGAVFKVLYIILWRNSIAFNESRFKNLKIFRLVRSHRLDKSVVNLDISTINQLIPCLYVAFFVPLN